MQKVQAQRFAEEQDGIIPSLSQVKTVKNRIIGFVLVAEVAKKVPALYVSKKLSISWQNILSLEQLTILHIRLINYFF